MSTDSGECQVTSSDEARFLPVYVKYKSSRTGFSIKHAEAAQFEKANAVIAFGIGATLGTFAAYFGGRIEALIMRIIDLQLSFPAILLALVPSTGGS